MNVFLAIPSANIEKKDESQALQPRNYLELSNFFLIFASGLLQFL